MWVQCTSIAAPPTDIGWWTSVFPFAFSRSPRKCVALPEKLLPMVSSRTVFAGADVGAAPGARSRIAAKAAARAKNLAVFWILGRILSNAPLLRLRRIEQEGMERVQKEFAVRSRT